MLLTRLHRSLCSYSDVRSLLLCIIQVSNQLEEGAANRTAAQVLALMVRRIREYAVPTFLAGDCVNCRRGVME